MSESFNISEELHDFSRAIMNETDALHYTDITESSSLDWKNIGNVPDLFGMPSKMQRVKKLLFRCRATMTVDREHMWVEDIPRSNHLRIIEPVYSDWVLGVLSGNISPLLVAPLPAIVHRALVCEWIDGVQVLSSLHARMYDLTIQDVEAANSFFSVIDMFVMLYFGWKDPTSSINPRAYNNRARKAAKTGLIEFYASRNYMEHHLDSNSVLSVLEASKQAFELTLRATMSEATCKYGIQFNQIERMTRAWACLGRNGQIMVAILSRGLSAADGNQASWIERVLRFAPKDLSIPQMIRMMNAHVGKAALFRKVQAEYCSKFESRSSSHTN